MSYEPIPKEIACPHHRLFLSPFMKNKDKYDLTKLTIKPKYQVTGCGKKITSRFTFDVMVNDEVVGKEIKAKDNVFPWLMAWLEEEN